MVRKWIVSSMVVGLVAVQGSLAAPQVVAPAGFANFIKASGDKLMDGSKELRFVSINVPNLHFIEDPQTKTVDWHLPVAWEQEDAIKTVAQLGGQVTRMYTVTVKGGKNIRNELWQTDGAGNFNEAAWKPVDKALELCNKYGIRIIIPFVDQWDWVGGKDNYAGGGDFWDVNSGKFTNFKKTIDYMLNRTNSYTGVKYKDDKAILAWETGNEISSSYAWTQAVAKYVKSIDPNHLVLDGNNNYGDGLKIPEIDLVTNHYYDNVAGAPPFPTRANNDRNSTKGKKPFIIGEFGCAPLDWLTGTLKAGFDNGTSGTLIWSLRFHNKNGGFYFHRDQDKSDSYHFPGFAVNKWYQETEVLTSLRQYGFQVQGLSVPPLSVPEAPSLLPILDAKSISWRGSVGAASYDVERATSDNGPWTVVGKDIPDAVVIEDAGKLFSDNIATKGVYSYRVKAKNSSGASPYSDIVVFDNSSENIALSKNATASAQDVGFAASAVVDGNGTTRWATPTPYSDAQWIAVDLGKEMHIKRVALNWEAAFASQYTLEVSSDGTNWKTIFTETAGDGGVDAPAISEIDARHVRVNCQKRGTQWGYSLFEFEVYGTAVTSLRNSGRPIRSRLQLVDRAGGRYLETRVEGGTRLELYTMEGVKIRQVAGSEKTSLDLSGLPAGLYHGVSTEVNGARVSETIHLVR